MTYCKIDVLHAVILGALAGVWLLYFIGVIPRMPYRKERKFVAAKYDQPADVLHLVIGEPQSPEQVNIDNVRR